MEEKIISEFKSIGCKIDKQAAVATQVYLELTEVKKYWNVEYFYDSISDIIYFTGKQSKSSNTTVYIPVHTSQDISFNILQKYLHLSTKHDAAVILVFVESNSTCVFYQFNGGLSDVPPVSSKTGEDSKRERLDSEIRKLSPFIQQSALCGLPLSMFTKDS